LHLELLRCKKVTEASARKHRPTTPRNNNENGSGTTMNNTRHMRRAALVAITILATNLGCAGTDADGRELTRDDAGIAADGGSDLADAAGANNSTDASSSDASADATSSDAASTNNNNGVCQPNFDGRVDRSEVTLRSGLSAKFKVGVDAPVDLQGTDVNGVRTWDFAGDLPGDQLELVELRDPDTFWFSATFPSATYVARLSAREELLGVFQATDDALLLLGVASPEDGLFATELEYDPPVEVLTFPLEEGSTWTGEHDVTGTAQGTPVLYTEEYASEVFDSGELTIPFGSFDVQAVRVELTRTIGFLETNIRTYAFVSECFGTVATVTSQDDDDAIFFTEAAEIRRLAP
jgi:hypothetical protein